MIRSATANRTDPTLTVDGCPETLVTGEGDLRSALEGFPAFTTGKAAVLARGPQDYIKAVRHGELWAVTTRKGSLLSLGSFTAELTTDYSERTTRESRTAGPLWSRIRRWAASPYPERALSTAQVETLFVEYLLGRKFSIPFSGA